MKTKILTIASIIVLSISNTTLARDCYVISQNKTEYDTELVENFSIALISQYHEIVKPILIGGIAEDECVFNITLSESEYGVSVSISGDNFNSIGDSNSKSIEGIKHSILQAIIKFYPEKRDNICSVYNCGEPINTSTDKVTLKNSISELKTAYNYYYSKEKKSDYLLSLKHFRSSAELGNAEAMALLANQYYYGEGVTIDFSASFFWAKKSASKNNVLGAFILGKLYDAGLGVKRDVTKAMSLIKGTYWGIVTLAEKGNPLAQYHLSTMYRYGLGTEINIAKSKAWATRSNSQGLNVAKVILGRIYVEEKTDSTIPVGIKYLQEAINQGVSSAYYQLGALHTSGFLGKREFDKGFNLVLNGAKAGDVDAQLMVGSFYFLGEDVSKDIEESTNWIFKAAKTGYVKAESILGAIYFQEKDYVNAEKWYKKSVLNGNKDSQAMLGYIYYLHPHLFGVSRSEAKLLICNGENKGVKNSLAQALNFKCQ